jgi:hypothetical protein
VNDYPCSWDARRLDAAVGRHVGGPSRTYRLAGSSTVLKLQQGRHRPLATHLASESFHFFEDCECVQSTAEPHLFRARPVGSNLAAI